MLPPSFLLSPEFAADPYPLHAELRERGPVHAIEFPPGARGFLVVGYEHGRAALSDPRLSKDTRHSELPVRGELFFGDTLLGVDPPDHTRLRALVAKAFTARRTESLRPRVQEIADALLDAIAGDGEADLIESFAFPLPIIVICELIGVPAADRDAIRAWTAALTVPSLSAEATARRRTAAKALNAYLRDILAERRLEPQDDLLTALLAAREGDALLAEAELLGTIALILIAGHETTVNLIGNGVLALLRNRDQRALLAARPDLIPAAVEEFLRYDPPVERATQRIALEDLEIAGTPIPRGSWVHISLAAAHHDPAAFANPSRLDLTRPDNRHIAFGHGIHHCLGAPLARLEGQIAFETLLRRLPTLELATDDPTWAVSGSIVRGLTALPVRF
ncbi:cytochrome P450 [Acrocarpospora corrugata]|uniref:Cytochrome P450 n=1 Tax=Acrocarpospora corrugata TaxID=35763 RepID=A0A5M3W9P1_9ACTN|nr:cytochrome P450 [Acrocarpospora corrugata]GES03228.1 cytochrome P450 [Acrocarpospora corrugata]